MLTQEEMLEIAEHYMEFTSHSDIELELYYDGIVIKPYGNIYDSKKYKETREFKYHVPSSPFLVEKETPYFTK